MQGKGTISTLTQGKLSYGPTYHFDPTLRLLHFMNIHIKMNSDVDLEAVEELKQADQVLTNETCMNDPNEEPPDS